jgi:predicted membrane channel-forming protein YqfA (hemolysin III family)
MTPQLVNPLIRCSVYLYFASGMAVLVSGGMVSILRYQADKKFAAVFLLVVAVGIFGLLALASWNEFRRPISGRKWIALCMLSSLGIVELLFAPTSNGGTLL